ncbi:tRNA (guanine-N(1)-)-methyltransferase [bacterium HR08]|nr:tRNA (guanine-N(1)-)-methyltransferase [bacterium HR08]
MRFDILTIFPEMFRGPFDYGIVRRARERGLVEIVVHNLRDFTTDKHRTVDDRPFGGGEGMVFKPEPIFRAVESVLGERFDRERVAVVLLTPQGRVFTQAMARQLAQCARIVLICGRYEGVDERVAEHLATHEISIGDYVLAGGEIPAMVIVEAIVRLLPGALGCEESARRESFAEGGILDHPQYTRPADFRGLRVPDVLLSGHHAEIARWRRRMALAKTLRNRPDLLEKAVLSDEDRRVLEELRRALPKTDESR